MTMLILLLLILPVFLGADTARKITEQKQVQVPPEIHPSDAEHRKILAEFKISASYLKNYPMLYVLREMTVSTPDANKNFDVNLRDILYINHPKYTIRVADTGKNLLPAKVILPDGRWFQCSPKALPALSNGSVVILHKTHRAASSALLPLAQFIWKIQANYPVCALKVVLPAKVRVKFYEVPIALFKNRQQKDGRVIYSCKTLIPPFSPNPWGAYPHKHIAQIMVVTDADWEAIRQWSVKMTSSAGKTDHASRQLLKQLTAGISDDTEKVRRVYNYLNTLRYLTIPVGETALKPQEPGRMIRNGYGDCKDKSNALVVFCREMGIPAEMVLVHAQGQVDVKFPSWDFNHMMVYIPKLSRFPQGLWLDPAGGSAAFGELPPGTLDTFGLVIGDKLQFRKVAIADPDKATSSIKDEIIIHVNGSVAVTRTYKGIFAQQFRTLLGRLQPHTRSGLENMMDECIPGCDMLRFHGNAKLNTGTFTGHFPLPEYLPQFTVPHEFTKPFIQRSIARDIRLYDGHCLIFHRKMKLEGKAFEKTIWQIQRDRYHLGIQTNHDTIEYFFKLERKGDNSISPVLYKELRSSLNQFRIRLNNIREKTN